MKIKQDWRIGQIAQLPGVGIICPEDSGGGNLARFFPFLASGGAPGFPAHLADNFFAYAKFRPAPEIFECKGRPESQEQTKLRTRPQTGTMPQGQACPILLALFLIHFVWADIRLQLINPGGKIPSSDAARGQNAHVKTASQRMPMALTLRAASELGKLARMALNFSFAPLLSPILLSVRPAFKSASAFL